MAVGVFLEPVDASALSCAPAGVTAPFLRTTDVPTNTRIWCTEEQEWPIQSIVLKDAQGSVVSGTQTTLSLPDMTVVVFRPDVELDPESKYTYQCPLLDVSEFTFTTGTGPRIGTPPVPDSSGWTAQAFHRDDVGDNYLVSFENAAEADSIVVLDIGGVASIAAEAPSGVVSDVTDAVYVDSVYVGSGACENNWPDATLGASTTVALGAFDVTGAFSGWSDTITVTLPNTLDNRSLGSSTLDGEETPSAEGRPNTALRGCSLIPVPNGSGIAVWALAAVTGLAAARRRRHHSTRR
jgi:MYXO-CTERM domain-containing protein